MIWVILLCALVLLIGYAIYRKSGEGYSAGRGMFKMSDDNIYGNKEEEDFSDYEPFNFDEMMK